LIVTRKSPEYVYQPLILVLGAQIESPLSKDTDIDQVGLVSGVQIVDHRGFVQMGQFRHIVCLVKLGRVDLVNLVGIHFSLL
jgi:hypothetical protein